MLFDLILDNLFLDFFIIEIWHYSLFLVIDLLLMLFDLILDILFLDFFIIGIWHYSLFFYLSFS